jgi:hypothetical protein
METIIWEANQKHLQQPSASAEDIYRDITGLCDIREDDIIYVAICQITGDVI